MKIIERKTYKDWTHTFQCERCESKLEAEPSDLRGVYHEGWSDPRDGAGESAYWSFDVTCSVCDTVHPVPANLIPNILQDEIKKRCQGRGSVDYTR